NALAASGSLGTANVYRFSSKEVQDSYGLYYYGYRCYSPYFQRWLNRDPVGAEYDVDLYRYVYNSPLHYVDPDGLWGIAFGNNDGSSYFNIGWGDPSLYFSPDSLNDLGQGAAATADGLLDAATFNGAFGLFDPGVFGR